MHSHFKVVCPICDSVVSQCRCIAEKTIEYQKCSSCTSRLGRLLFAHFKESETTEVEAGALRKMRIINKGSQLSKLLVRHLMECGIPFTFEKIPNPSGIIITGGPGDVVLDDDLLEAIDSEVPILGVCYGFQAILKRFGAEIVPHGEFGPTEVRCQQEFLGVGEGTSLSVYMSHNSGVVKLPDCFKTCMVNHPYYGIPPPAAVKHEDKPIYATLFHPESTHTEFGKTMLAEFYRVCGHTIKETSLLEEPLNVIKNLPSDAKVLLAYSGGVDSSVLFHFLNAAGVNVTGVLVDTGLMRKNEIGFIKALSPSNLEIITSNLFLERLVGVTDPEAKRKIIGNTFIDIFKDYAKDKGFTHLAQGTIYPDVVESGKDSGSDVIKSHHNVGGLPDKLGFELLEPFRNLYKDQVRCLGLGLVPDELLNRHPFPGPGLAIRIIGEVTKEKADLLREADKIWINFLKEKGLYDSIWQAFAILLPVNTVGVKGDARTYEPSVCLRAVTSEDGMTTGIPSLDTKMLSEVAVRITNQLALNRVFFDLTTKPPGTIEVE